MCGSFATREFSGGSSDDASSRTVHGFEMGQLRGLPEGDPTRDTGAASECPACGVETEYPSERVRRARERDLRAEPVVDHDDVLKEMPPEHDASGAQPEAHVSHGFDNDLTGDVRRQSDDAAVFVPATATVNTASSDL